MSEYYYTCTATCTYMCTLVTSIDEFDVYIIHVRRETGQVELPVHLTTYLHITTTS